MSTVYFPAIIEGDRATGYNVFFPDLPGLASAGATIQEAALRASEALQGHVNLMVEEGEAAPSPSSLDEVAVDPDVHEAGRVLVPVDIPSTRTVRINITLPEDLVRRIDSAAPNRSRFLAEAAEKVLGGG